MPLLALLAVLLPGAAAQQQCQRIDLPAMYTSGDTGTYNPAAFYHDDHGWFAFANTNPCHFTRCGPGAWLTQPVGIYLGKGHGPDLSMARFSAHNWTVDTNKLDWRWGCNYTTAIAEQCADPQALEVHTEDYRPFIWNREVFVSLTFQLVQPSSPGYMYRPVVALAKPGWEERRMVVQQVFFRTIRKAHPKPRQLEWNWEKNWGFFPLDGRVYVLHQAFPCLVMMEWDPKDKRHGWKYSEGSCYVNDGGEKLKEHMRAKLPAFDVRISGHPQVWGDHLYVMVHTVHKPKSAETYADEKQYFHYLLKVDMVFWRVTHMSKHPVVSTLNYTTSGPLRGAIVVGSFHPGMEIPSGRELFQVFMGEADKYSCQETVLMEKIDWLELDASNWSPSQPASDFFEAMEGEPAANTGGSSSPWRADAAAAARGAAGRSGGVPLDPWKRHN